MKIKEIVVDLAVTLFIAVTVYTDQEWMIWLLAAYTLLMLLSRSLYLFSRQLRAIVNKNKPSIPRIYYHLLYCLNVLLLSIFGWYLLAAGWLVIWGLAYFGMKQI